MWSDSSLAHARDQIMNRRVCNFAESIDVDFHSIGCHLVFQNADDQVAIVQCSFTVLARKAPQLCLDRLYNHIGYGIHLWRPGTMPVEASIVSRLF